MYIECLKLTFLQSTQALRNEALRRHAKASLALANELQHKRTAQYKDAAICAGATRTVVLNIVAIVSATKQAS